MKLSGLFTAAAPAMLLSFATPCAQGQTITPLASFSNPVGVVADSSGDIFVADFGSGVVKEIVAPGYTTLKTIATLTRPVGVALDAAGNLYVAVQSQTSITEFLAASGYSSSQSLGSGFNGPTGVAVDSGGNVYVADQANNQVKKIPAGNGAPLVLGSGFSLPGGVAVDQTGNVYVADTGNNAIKKILTNGTVQPLGSGFSGPTGVALDASGNLYVADAGNNGIKELLAAGGYTTILPVGIGFNNAQGAPGFKNPQGVAVDSHGNVFIGDSGNGVVEEATVSTPLVASVLPGSRSVQLGSPATVLATMINSGSAALSNCGITLPVTAPAGISLSFQTTNPSTNALTGSPNATVAIPGNNGLQTFLITLGSSQAFSVPQMPIAFLCVGSTAVQEASIVPGVDTVDLTMSTTPIADVIALAATPSLNGVLQVPVGGANAFAVATSNVGAGATLTASVDTGTASLPLTVELCQSNPSNGQCLSSPAASVSLTDAAGATPTFSVFASAASAIPFSPATNRIFVRFKDSSGGLHGSTSVAVQTK
jgi:streptogramin lyase